MVAAYGIDVARVHRKTKEKKKKVKVGLTTGQHTICLLSLFVVRFKSYVLLLA